MLHFTSGNIKTAEVAKVLHTSSVLYYSNSARILLHVIKGFQIFEQSTEMLFPCRGK